MTIGLLVSGNLGFVILNKLLQDKRMSVIFVLTDTHSENIMEMCKFKNIKYFSGNPRNGKAQNFLSEHESPLLILSVNYLFIIEEDIIKKARKFAINIHGSLLPKYRGRTPHIWAIINNEKKTGITAHLIEKGCDEGDIIMQVQIPILDFYTGQDLLNVFNKKYPLMIDELISKIETNNIHPIKQNHSLATYFGKRTAEDGRVDFEWQKERIYNWVRAQADPYPGAFCFVESKKIILNQVEFSDYGFMQNMRNGLVIKVENGMPFIKTQNGVLRLTNFKSEYTINEGDLLS